MERMRVEPVGADLRPQLVALMRSAMIEERQRFLADDEATVAAMVRADLAPFGPDYHRIEEGHELLRLLDQHDQMVGFLWIGPAADRPDVADIYYIRVEPTARRHGYGHLLVDYAERWAKDRNYASLGLSVFAGNEDAIRLYEEFGFAAERVSLIKQLEGAEMAATTPQLPAVMLGRGGVPALILPCFGTPDEVADQLTRAAELGADVAEWRVDLSSDWEACIRACATSTIPVIATLRSAEEGGNYENHSYNYAAEVMKLVLHPFAAVDIEAARPGADQAIAAARDNGVLAIASHHDTVATPSNSDMMRILEEMIELRPDILKLACTPGSTGDTWRQMDFTRSMRERLSLPLISVSMGAAAAWTRLAVAASGSVATFASLDAPSAPGQLEAGLVRHVLDALGPAD